MGVLAGSSSGHPKLRWDLLWQMTKRVTLARFRRSRLGLAWLFLGPLLTATVMVAAFAGVFRIPGQDLAGYSFYVLSGVVFIQFISIGLMSVATWGTSHRGVVTRIRVPILLYPLSALFASIATLLIGLLYTLIVGAIAGQVPNWKLPVALACLSAFVLGVGLWLGVYQVSNEDIGFLLPIVVQAFTYLTPVFYQEYIWPEGLARILRLNPLVYLLRLFREGLGYEPLDSTAVLVAPLTAIAALVLGLLAHRRNWYRSVARM